MVRRRIDGTNMVILGFCVVVCQFELIHHEALMPVAVKSTGPVDELSQARRIFRKFRDRARSRDYCWMFRRKLSHCSCKGNGPFKHSGSFPALLLPTHPLRHQTKHSNGRNEHDEVVKLTPMFSYGPSARWKSMGSAVVTHRVPRILVLLRFGSRFYEETAEVGESHCCCDSLYKLYGGWTVKLELGRKAEVKWKKGTR
jgi:hypothetical protein